MALPSSLSGGVSLATPPLEVRLKRDSSLESVHRVHAVVCDQKGRILMRAGQPDFESFIRSALKPFQALPFLSSGAAAQVDCGERGLAISCASHAGTAGHAREAFKILWNAELEASQLQCPVPAGGSSPLEHNCPGKHAAFALLFCILILPPILTAMARKFRRVLSFSLQQHLLFVFLLESKLGNNQPDVVKDMHDSTVAITITVEYIVMMDGWMER